MRSLVNCLAYTHIYCTETPQPELLKDTHRLTEFFSGKLVNRPLSTMPIAQFSFVKIYLYYGMLTKMTW